MSFSVITFATTPVNEILLILAEKWKNNIFLFYLDPTTYREQKYFIIFSYDF